ncbi:imidazole glycerol phosphate synthase subunit HisH [Aminipila terrae]|uniref:Imidazole glycerol phosphate synthase subunit HisH n=1 Tax=Aminipila terrae TaxID=2697030 RepID=A0A6P1MGE0_9FIRM|nr:imidazole glycerol phosphate synthase subunit HisH [Aminipila terrae]QHI73122.1 imidazole glycerol phosphate synthase subunit HisH [Aminipila terrae]
MIVIIDYGVGNLFSLKSSLEAIGKEVTISGVRSVIQSADKILLPGVGAFCDAAKKLKENQLDIVIKEEVKKGKPIMGICLGMQLLFESSYEYGQHNGLGLIKGHVKPIAEVIPEGLKIPHIGWNALHFPKKKEINPIFKYTKENDCVYFVHSYYASDCADSVAATTEYGTELTAAVAYKNIYGCQFHPEKSGIVGLNILKAFCEIGD